MTWPRHRPRGYALIFVLTILLVLSLLVTSLFVQSSNSRASNLSGSLAQIAATNAARGAQEAVRMLRNSELDATALTGTCVGGPDVAANCTPGSYYASPLVQNSTVASDGSPLSASQGGGPQYSYIIFRSPILNQPLNRFTIQATGYAGMSTTSVNTATSVVEVEIELGSVAFKCVNAYDCSGG